MSLEIQRGRSKWWYGRVDVNGKQLSKNLGVEIKGAPPASLRELGDAAFERSRAKAQAALKQLQLDLKRRGTAEELVQAIHVIRTGERIRSIALDDCATQWEELPRRRPLMKAAGFFDVDDSMTEEEKKASRGEIHAESRGRLRKASVRDFHSFRVTWVTLALTAGVPLEVVKKVTGHRTADIVMKHYFQPGREEFRRTLASKLPALIGGAPEAKAPSTEEILVQLMAMEDRTWKSIRDTLCECISGSLPGAKLKTSEAGRLWCATLKSMLWRNQLARGDRDCTFGPPVPRRLERTGLQRMMRNPRFALRAGIGNERG